MTALVPWLPSLSLDVSRTRKVTARVSVKHARFVTLLGVASRLQGQKREEQCLQTLCKPEYQEQLAAAMLQGIRKYFARNPPLTRDKIAAYP